MTSVALPPTRRAASNGWWGMLLLVAAEAALVGAVVGSYFYLRVNTRVWPPRGIPEPSVTAPVVLAAVLLLTLVPFRAAVAFARRGEHGRTVALLALAAAGQAAYFGVQMNLFTESLARFEPQANAYASIYYVLLGVAHFHVAVGLLLDLWLLMRVCKRLTPYRVRALEAASLYWLFVMAVTVVVVLTELSPRL